MTDEHKEIQVVWVSVIATAMAFRNMSVKELATKCYVSEKYMRDILQCKKEINFSLLAKIKESLEIKFEVKAV